MHPECRASLSIVEKLIQYYPNLAPASRGDRRGAFSRRQGPGATVTSDPGLRPATERRLWLVLVPITYRLNPR